MTNDPYRKSPAPFFIPLMYQKQTRFVRADHVVQVLPFTYTKDNDDSIRENETVIGCLVYIVDLGHYTRCWESAKVVVDRLEEALHTIKGMSAALRATVVE